MDMILPRLPSETLTPPPTFTIHSKYLETSSFLPQYNWMTPCHPVHNAPDWHSNKYQSHPVNILQWNVGGLSLKTSLLWMTIQQHNLDVLMLQEISTKYQSHLTEIPFKGYRFIGDLHHKTGIYVKDTLYHHQIPLKLIEGTYAEDTLYASAVVIRTLQASKQKHILLLNIYRSPNGTQKLSETLTSYIQQCHHYCSGLPKPITIDDTLIGGDFNASHHLWGAHRFTKQNARYGRHLVSFAQDEGYHILNNGAPTRFRLDHSKHKVKYSWLDVTLASPRLYDCSTWQVQELDQKSDHYQIHIQISNHVAASRLPTESQTELDWTITDDATHWDTYQTALQTQWESVQSQMRILQNSRATPSNSQKLADLITDTFCTPARSVFGKKERVRHWKKWITSKAQSISIAYHRVYRNFMQKTHRTHADWSKLRAHRQKRNTIMRQHKREWIQKRFQRHKLHGKEGWQIAAEVRDMNEDRGRTLPDLHEGNAVVAKTTLHKVEYLNTHYHRFDELHSSATNTWCWRSEHIIHPPPVPSNYMPSRHLNTRPQPLSYSYHWQASQH